MAAAAFRVGQTVLEYFSNEGKSQKTPVDGPGLLLNCWLCRIQQWERRLKITDILGQVYWVHTSYRLSPLNMNASLLNNLIWRC